MNVWGGRGVTIVRIVSRGGLLRELSCLGVGREGWRFVVGGRGWVIGVGRRAEGLEVGWDGMRD